MKKKILVASIATGLLIAPVLPTVLPTVVTAASTTGLGLTFLDRVTITPVAPAQSVIGQETTINFNVDWENPAEVNVTQTVITINGNAEFIFFGHSSSDFVVRSNGDVSYINMDLQDITSFPLVLKATGPGPVTVDMVISYSDGVGEEEKTTSIELNVVNDDRSLENSKAEAIAEISQLENISEAEKTGYINSVEASTTVEEVANHLAAAKEKDRQIVFDKLNDAKEQARTTVNGLENLTVQQNQDFLGEIELASTVSEVEAIVAAAIQANGGTEDTVAKAKAEAIAEINKLENLSADEKADYINSVEASTTVEEVATHLATAKAKDNQNALAKLTIAKEKARVVINGLDKLTAQQRKDFLGQVDLASTVSEVEAIVAAAIQANGGTEDTVAKAKAEAIAEINKLENLSADEKAGYINSVEASTTVEEVATHLATAKAKDNQNALAKLTIAKEKARVVINGLDKLTAQQRKDFLGQVDLASTVSEVEAIVAAAIQANGGTKDHTSNPSTGKGTTTDKVEKGTSSGKSSLPTTGETATGLLSLLGVSILGALSWFRFKK